MDLNVVDDTQDLWHLLVDDPGWQGAPGVEELEQRESTLRNVTDAATSEASANTEVLDADIP